MEDQKEYRRIVYLIAIIAALGGLLFGLDQGFVATALKSIKTAYSLTTYQVESYTAILAIGGVFGTVCAGFTNKFIGRKNSLVLAGIIFTLMSFVSALLPSFEILKLARFF
ncbi:hypothetical protein fh0823_17710 [Francisella halioticida]|nr:MFS transporter [Francisella halioticida]BCD91632.1 hypothetical protein fh0823_17710 [Francisella halioticida]